MKFSTSREALLAPLQLVSGAVERRQTLPILSNVLLSAEDGKLSITATDLELELIGQMKLNNTSERYDITVPGRKLLDIIRSLPNEAEIKVEQQDTRLIVRSGKSRFVLSTLPASEFPNVEEGSISGEFELPQQELKALLEKTHFAMAHQDVRYYLNGLLFDLSPEGLTLVATDGHRLALSEVKKQLINQSVKVILPRKGVLELMRLLQDSDEAIVLKFGDNHLRAFTEQFTFTSKLIEGKFPDYQRVIPRKGDKRVSLDIPVLKQALLRAAILSNQKYHGIRLDFDENSLKISATNTEHEEAEEELLVDYQESRLELGFNVNYLLDILSTFEKGQLTFTMSDTNSSTLIQFQEDDSSLYVVMPMRL